MIHDAAGVLLDIALKSAIVLGAITVIDLALRRLSAAERHLLWTCALLGLLALPLAITVIPDVRVNVPGLVEWPAAPAEAPPGGASASTGAIPSAAPVIVAQIAAPAPSPPLARLADFVARNLSTAVSGAYAVVAAGLLAVLGTALWRAHAQVRGLPLVTDAGVLRRAAELARALRVERAPELRVSALDSTPWAWGARRPIVALPLGFERWPEHEQRAALVHELAHVARRDFSTTLAACACCALYWFNPLAWLALKRVRRESERACDDAVLGAGVAGSAYAGQLLALAGSVRAHGAAPALGAPMARRSPIADRIRSIVATGRRREPAGNAKAAAAALLVVALVLPLAPLRSQSGDTPAELSPIENVWRSDGPVIEVVRTASGGSSFTFRNHVLAFSADGRYVGTLPSVSGSENLEIRSALDGTLVWNATYPHDAGLAYGLAFSPNGTIALGRFGNVSLYSGAAPETLLAMYDADRQPAGPPGDPSCTNQASCSIVVGPVAFSPDGKLLAFKEVRPTPPDLGYEGFLHVVDLSTGMRVASLEAAAPRSVAFSPDGRRLAALHRVLDSSRSTDLHFRVWDTSTWQLLLDVGGLGHGGEQLAIGAVAATSYAAAYSSGDQIVLRDLARDRVLWSAHLLSPPFEPPPNTIREPRPVLEHVAITPNGKYVVGYEGPGWVIRQPILAGYDGLGYVGMLVVRDARDGSVVAAHDIRNLTDLAISPDSSTVAYGVGFHQTYVALARLPR